MSLCTGGGGSECCEDDDKVVDLALEAHVFHFLSNSVVAAQGFHSEEFYLRRLHGIISDFIYQMPLKVSLRKECLCIMTMYTCSKFEVFSMKTTGKT